MVVDVGGGTTEVAMISLGGIVTSESIRVGGDEMDQAIIVFAKKEHSLMLGERTAEEIKMAIGSACPCPEEPHAEIRGRDLVSGLPKTWYLCRGGSARDRRTGQHDRGHRRDHAGQVPARAGRRRHGPRYCPTGGGALLRGLDERLRDETGMPIQLAGNPLESVVLGAGNAFRTSTPSSRCWYRTGAGNG